MASECSLKQAVLTDSQGTVVGAQITCVEILKLDASTHEQRDVGISYALTLWLQRGYAGLLPRLYAPDLSHEGLYRNVRQLADSVVDWVPSLGEA